MIKMPSKRQKTPEKTSETDTANVSVMEIVNSLKQSLLPEIQTMVQSAIENFPSGSVAASQGRPHCSDSHSREESDNNTDSELTVDPPNDSSLSRAMPAKTKTHFDMVVKTPITKSERAEILGNYPIPSDTSVQLPRVDSVFEQMLRQRNISLRF